MLNACGGYAWTGGGMELTQKASRTRGPAESGSDGQEAIRFERINHSGQGSVTPQARLSLWRTVVALEHPESASQSLQQLAIVPDEHVPRPICGELARLGYYEPEGDWFKLTAKGREWIHLHSDRSRRLKELQYLAFDAYREVFADEEDPNSHTAFSLGEDWCSTRGASLREVKRALEALRRAGLLEQYGGGVEDNETAMYQLSDLGKGACDDERLIEGAIEGRSATQPPGVNHVHNNHNYVEHGQIFQNTGPGSVSVDQGDIVFGAAVPAAREAEIRRLLGELSAGFAAEDVAPADREDAQDALTKIGAELGKPEPHKARLVRAADTVSQVAEPFDKLASIAAQTIAVLQAIGLLPSL